jgi:hypothetical protein
VEFPGLLGVALYRLRTWMRGAPIASLGPLLGFIAADIAVDLQRGRLGGVGIELVIAPLIAVTVSMVAQRDHAGMSAILLLVLGAVSALGASALLALGFGYGVAPVVVMGLRHLAVATYAWAAIAAEPPPRRRLVLRPIPT